MSPVRIRNFTALNCEKKEGALTLRATSGWLLIRTYRGWGKQGHASDDDDHNVDVDVNKER